MTVSPETEMRRMYEAARLYYEDEASQAEVAKTLGVSRPTVSRLLSQARRIGIVRIEVIDPDSAATSALESQLAELLGLKRCYIAPGLQTTISAPSFEPLIHEALADMALRAGDALVLASGVAIHGLAQHRLPALSGVTVVPAVGGMSEPEMWHQTNELVRMVAESSQAQPAFLFAPALASDPMKEALLHDPGYQEITALWGQAKGALLGVGAPTATRTSLSSAIPQGSEELKHAVGDIGFHFYDVAGHEIVFPNSENLVRISTEQLQAIPHSTAVAIGTHKALSIRAGAELGLFNRLITDDSTAKAILALHGESERTA